MVSQLVLENPQLVEKKEYCGLFGVFGDAEAVHKVYLGLFALQHRGQESAGIEIGRASCVERVYI